MCKALGTSTENVWFTGCWKLITVHNSSAGVAQRRETSVTTVSYIGLKLCFENPAQTARTTK